MVVSNSDTALLSRIAKGDHEAIKVMVNLKLPRLLALATRMLNNRSEAEEIAQETFIRIWKKAPIWRYEEATFDTWIHRVALNLCYDRLRAHREKVEMDMPELEDEGNSPHERLEASQNKQGVAAALGALPLRQKEALVLQYYQGFSNKETADLMGISVDALESLLSRARRNMRSLLLEKN